MTEIVIGTGNSGKIREFREMLEHGAGGISWRDASSLGALPHIEETGKTFLANACLKASGFALHYREWALADDSGLEVDALDGSPGVFSARWAELNRAGKGDADNNQLLLRQLDAVDDSRRTARFVCVLAVSDPQGRIALTTRGTVEGRIIREPRGDNGFGYDPLFLIDQIGRTTAQLDPDQKHRISHRGNALAAMRNLLSQISFS